MVRVFRCARTGLYYPEDFVEMWGIRYGRGLGRHPISEAMINQYNRPIAEAKDSRRTMHPIGYCRSQVDFMEVTEEEYAAHVPIIVFDDPSYHQIGQVMRDKQLIKSPKMMERFPKEIELARERISERLEASRKKLGVSTVTVPDPEE